MLERMCCRRESVAAAEASGRGPLERTVGSDRWHPIGPQLPRAPLVHDSGPWRMDHMYEGTARDHQHLRSLMLDWRGEVCGSRRQNCRLRGTECSRYRKGRGVDGR